MTKFIPIAAIASILIGVPFTIFNFAAVLSDEAELSDLFDAMARYAGVLVYSWSWFMACSFATSLVAFWIFTRATKDSS